MGVVVVNTKVTPENLVIASQDHGDYIKVVVDVENSIVAIGGEWHADAEKVLLDSGSRQANLWGGGVDMVTKQIDFISLINTRPGFNNSQEILDAKIREVFERIVKDKFNL